MIFERLLKILFCLFIYSWATAQDFSNKGTDFWVGYGYHQSMIVDNNQDMVLYFTSDVAATVKVEIASLNWSKTYSVAANSVKESDVMPKTAALDARLLSEGTYSSGIHITSDNPIVAYTHIYNQTVSGASLLFPVTTLGQDYYSLNFTQNSNNDNSNSWAYVIATEDNTTIEITPSAKTLTHAAGLPFTVPLNKGQVYNLMGNTNGINGQDLTGTRIRSVSTGTTGCKKIAVFSGSGRLSINCENAVSSSDNIIQQAFPASAWGKKFLTVPTAQLQNNYFRIAVSDPATKVTVDGVQLTNLVNSFYYDITANTPKSIIADKPVMVAQYITSANVPACGNPAYMINNEPQGDPEMIYLSPVEQTIDKITLNSTPHFEINTHYINVIIKTSAVNSFTLDGVGKVSSFASHPRDPSYSYAVFSVAKGAHNLKADSGFNAIAYGYGSLESYGYNAGTNIKDLNQFISLKNAYATVNYPTTCRNTKFLFSITLPFQASALTWDFGLNSHITPNQPVTQINPKLDSSYVRDGTTLYVYSLPSLYSYDAVGNYPLEITANNQTSDGCNGVQKMTYNVQVLEAPFANFSNTFAGCVTDSVYFKDESNGNGKQLVKWRWEFGDGTTDTVTNPHKAYTQSGTYNIKHTAINDIGCSTDTTRSFTIAPQPIAKFSFSTPGCEGSAITFTDASTIVSGKIVKWYWNFGNGNIVTNTNGNPVIKTFNAAGTYPVSLQVENESGCKSLVSTQTITVYSSPAVDFDMPGACLPSGNAVFKNLTTIKDGTDNSITYAWTFGDGGTSTVKNPSHTYTAAGPFSVNLKGTSVNGCIKDSTRVFNNIYPQPVAAFNYSPLKICVSDSVYFTDASSAKNSKVSEWFWDFGGGKTTTLQNPVFKFADSGSYQVSLYIKSSAGCSSETTKKTIYINKSPTAAFTISGATCQNQPFTITDQSKPNSGTINTWFWNFPGGTTETHLNGNTFTKSATSAGDYIISLVVQTDNGCKSDTVKQTAVVRPLPVADFILPEICANDPFAVFKDSSYMPGNASTAFTYKWNFGDANATAANPNTSTVQNPQHKYSIAGPYNVSLTVTANTGCSATTTKTLNVNGGSPKADFSVIDDGAICDNAQVRIKNNSSIDIGSITRLQVIWDSQNNPTVVETDDTPFAGKIYTHTFPGQPTVKTYQVKMISFSGTNCFNEKVVPVTVSPSPKVSFSPVAAICITDNSRPITQARETTGSTGTFTFSGNGVSAQGLFNPASAGAGTATIKYIFTSSAGCKDSALQTIEVIPTPEVKLTSPVYVLEGGSADLIPSITGNIATYLWTPATYLNNPNIKNPQSVPKDSITYKLTATTQEGCVGTGQVRVLVLTSLGIPNSFSPNGDGINDVWNIASLASYPDCTVEVFNRFGTIVYRSTGYSKPWNGTLNGASLPVGVYYYVINPKNGRKPYTGNVTILR